MKTIMQVTRQFVVEWKWVHKHHHHLHVRALKHAGKAGIFAEGGYHAFEIAGLHGPLMVCAAVLLAVTVLHVVAGEIG